ncbi:hypothetical protein ACM66B_000662 [Microbotryomycetes sp. NB124-2]
MAAVFQQASGTARRTLMQRACAQWAATAFASSSTLPSTLINAAYQRFDLVIDTQRLPQHSRSIVERWQALWMPAAQETLAGLRELLPPWLLAAPKRRTTHSAKRMRHSNKGLREKNNIVACPGCGAPKLAHHLCHDCHVAFRQEIHAEAKQQAAVERRATGQQ